MPLAVRQVPEPEQGDAWPELLLHGAKGQGQSAAQPAVGQRVSQVQALVDASRCSSSPMPEPAGTRSPGSHTCTGWDTVI